ncbi:thiamine phosphate synthase [Magnetospirillum aberrantis]|uniref:Thiamine phosphate synthase n=1 Tax=Magnetospirillum aberrantis SpK TaxID=908842 RepID=A0A7C9QR27_9PROT|nr:thiamine phosphate synthase [Magnetospirillum aberrantis]NFV78520.1 thiamine phosphate synthase [Magnetospirillum aberrantis SpK]
MTLTNLSRRKKPPCRLLVSDEIRLPDPTAAAARLSPGDGVLLRHYHAVDRAALARRLAIRARERRLVLLMAGGDWRLAALVGAHGVHLPQNMARGLCDPGLRLWLRRGHLLSVACHDRAALARARTLGADMATLSPVFPTRSHPGAPSLGITRFALWTAKAGLPVLALGGVNRRTARTLRFAAGWAAIDGLR